MPNTRLSEGIYPGARALGMGQIGQAVWVQLPGFSGTLRAIAVTEINRLSNLTVTIDSAGAARVFNEIPQRTVLQRQGRFIQTRPNPVEELEQLYGVVYAVVTGRGILVGGDRIEPALIEVDDEVSIVHVQQPGSGAIVYWVPVANERIVQWVEGEQAVINRSFDAALGGGWLQSREISIVDSVFSGRYYLSSPDGGETVGEFSGTDESLENGPVNFTASVPIISGITRPCSVYQLDSFEAIAGSYDAQQPLLIRSDGMQAIALHRYGSVSPSARSQECRVFTVDAAGTETPINSTPGLLIPVEFTAVEPGVIELEPNWPFDNYLDDSARPIFDALNGMAIVLVSRRDGVIIKGFGTVVGHTSELQPATIGGRTFLRTITLQISRVMQVPFDAALFVEVSGTDATVLYSNTGSVIDFLLQSQAYRYATSGANTNGLGSNGDLSEKVPLGNFNLVGNSLIDGSNYVQWIGERIYVSEAINTTSNLEQPLPAYADEWQLVQGGDGLLFIKQDEPVQSGRSPITEQDEIYSLLSSAFYQR